MFFEILFEFIFELIIEALSLPFRFAWRRHHPPNRGAAKPGTFLDPRRPLKTGEEMGSPAGPNPGEATTLWDQELDG